MEEALHDVPLYREFAKVGEGMSRLPDETTILRFRHQLARHDLAPDMLRLVTDILMAKGLMLRTGTGAEATRISAPSSTKNADGERDPEMKQTRKGNNWHFVALGLQLMGTSGASSNYPSAAANEGTNVVRYALLEGGTVGR